MEAAQGTLVGIDLMPMIKTKPLVVEAGDEGRTAAEPFYALAASGSVANFHLNRLRVCSPAVTQGAQRRRATRAISCKGAHVPPDIMLMGVRWYGAYP